MAKREYDWIDDPFDPEKQELDELEMKHARNSGCLIGVILLLAIIVILAIVFLGPLAFAGFMSGFKA